MRHQTARLCGLGIISVMYNQPSVTDSSELPVIITIIHTLVHALHDCLGRHTFSGVIERFRYGEMPERYSTRRSYESMLTQWIEPRWGHLRISAIRTADIEQWLREMDCSPKTRQHRKALLHVLFECAIRWEMTGRNPVAGVRLRGVTKRLRRPLLITLAELRLIIDRVKEPFRQMVLLAALLGLRASEVVALKWTDFDFSRLTVHVQRGSVSGRISPAKTESSEDLLPLHEDIARQMLLYQTYARRSEEGWVFPSPATGRPFQQDSIRKRHLIPAGMALGLAGTLGWHTFRHSYRRWLDEAGTPVGIIKELMRHADISTTMNVYGVGTLTPAKRDAHTALVTKALRQEAVA